MLATQLALQALGTVLFHVLDLELGDLRHMLHGLRSTTLHHLRKVLVHLCLRGEALLDLLSSALELLLNGPIDGQASLQVSSYLLVSFERGLDQVALEDLIHVGYLFV